jgi:hypothetical protein
VTSALSDQAAAAVAAALGVIPEEWWDVNDDRCDCTYQRIGLWTNPYLAETLEVRMCCIWAELYKLFPQHVRTVPAFQNYNTNEWETTPLEWDGEADMPPSIWYRQLARKTGRTVADVRAEYCDRDDERPRGVVRPVLTLEPEPSETDILREMILGLADVVSELKAQLEAK